jgi:hypothetical protein
VGHDEPYQSEVTDVFVDITQTPVDEIFYSNVDNTYRENTYKQESDPAKVKADYS